jgi:hypothetical protein
MCAARLLGPWDGECRVRWAASPFLRQIPPPAGGDPLVTWFVWSLPRAPDPPAAHWFDDLVATGGQR